MTGHGAGQHLDHRRLVDELFRDVTPSPEPSIVILTGGPGSAPARAIARLRAEYDDPVAVIDNNQLAALSGSADIAAQCVQFALSSRRSLVMCSSTPDIPAEMLASFADAEFTTRIVSVSARQTESLLSVVSAQLREAEIEALGTVESFDEDWSSSRSFVRSTQADADAYRVTVMDGDGNIPFDGSGEGAVRAFDEARLLPMSNLQSVAWLGELRRLAAYAVSGVPSRPSTSIREALIRLHEMALHQVLPQLPIRRDGPVAAAQLASLLKQRDRLAQDHRFDTSERARPSVQPPTSGGSRGL